MNLVPNTLQNSIDKGAVVSIANKNYTQNIFEHINESPGYP